MISRKLVFRQRPVKLVGVCGVGDVGVVVGWVEGSIKENDWIIDPTPQLEWNVA